MQLSKIDALKEEVKKYQISIQKLKQENKRLKLEKNTKLASPN